MRGQRGDQRRDGESQTSTQAKSFSHGGIVLGVSQTRQYLLQRVDDAAVVQMYADGFKALLLREKVLAWHLYLAAPAGRDIYYDQRHALNLDIRDVHEEILRHGHHVEPDVLAEVRRYTKLFWINTGPLSRVDALNLPSYTGVVMPSLTPRFDDGEIVDVEISYPLDLETQMLEHSTFARDADVLATPSASR